MLTVADIYKAVVTAPTIRVDDGVECDATAHNGLQSALFAVRHDLRIDAAVSFEDAEDNGLARGSATAFAANPSSAEARLILFDLARREGRGARALLRETLSDFEKDRGDRLACQTGECGRLTGRQIERETAHELTEFTFA